MNVLIMKELVLKNNVQLHGSVSNTVDYNYVQVNRKKIMRIVWMLF